MELLARNAEGVGYLLKDRVSDVDEFAAAVRRVAEGGSALDPAVVSQLVGRRRRDDPLEEADAARARGAGADGGRPLEPGDRGTARDHAPCGREAS
jgi:DNA-binding NarL/FixJ family response regulator